MIIKCNWCNDTVNSICTTDTANGARWLCDRHITETNRDMYYDRLDRVASRNTMVSEILRDYRKG